MYQRAPEVIALARHREDAANGEGSFDNLEAFVSAAGPKDGAARIVDRELSGMLDRAEADIREIFRALKGLTPPPGSSAWLRAVVTGQGRGDDIDIEQLRNIVRVYVEAASKLDPVTSGVMLSFDREGNSMPKSVTSPADAMEALCTVERFIRHTEAAAVALVQPLLLTDEGRAGLAAKVLDVAEPLPRMFLCMLALEDGSRESLLIAKPHYRHAKPIPFAGERNYLEGYRFLRGEEDMHQRDADRN